TLLDILRAASLALEFKADLDRSAFFADLKTQSAVLHQLMILGEAVKRLSDAFREQHPETPWRGYAGMRDRLIHGYDGVDLEEVWRTLEGDLPDLLAAVEPLAPALSPPSRD
ncbi:MAG: DUF86 domain-containing protein, partial [Thermoanaerobaculia bacterium]